MKQAAGRILAHIPEQFVWVERKPAKPEGACELPVRLAEAPPPRGESTKLAVADQNRHGLAPAGELHRPAVLRIANQRREVSSRFGDRTPLGHWRTFMFIYMYTISDLMATVCQPFSSKSG